ncbi:MAG: Bug family tripartite tricarboxylate transporter substrate binding protein [Lautropia sp.]
MNSMTTTSALRASALALAAVTIVAAAAADAAAAEPFPCKTIRLIAPNPPGGATDVLSRMLAAPLGRRLDVPVAVENKGGASTNIGNEYVVRAAPDGCTLLLGNISMALNKSLFHLNFEIEKDLRAVIQVASVPLVLFVHPSVKVTSVKEFIALAAASPGKVTFSSAGNGTPTHLIAEMINQNAGVKIVHVPYRGAGPATMDVIAGQITSSTDSLIPVVPHIRSQTVRALAVTGPARSPALPEVPTFREQGVDYVDLSLWYGVMAPARTPDAIVKRLNEELSAVLSSPEVREKLVSLGSSDTDRSPDAFQHLVASETARLGDLIRATGVKVE